MKNLSFICFKDPLGKYGGNNFFSFFSRERNG